MPQNIFREKESESCDYKLKYHENKAKLLHDMLCLSNADSKSPRQLILGVSDDQQEFPGVKEDPNRMTQAKLIDWLRKTNLNHTPTIELKAISIENIEFDIITIENRPEKPYFLEQYYRDGNTTLHQGAVYTRDKDVNTPIDRCATDKQIEKMYMERFGLPAERTRFNNRLIAVAYELPNNFRYLGNPQNPFQTQALEKLVHDEPLIHQDLELFTKANKCLQTARILSTSSHSKLKPADGQFLMKDLSQYLSDKYGITVSN